MKAVLMHEFGGPDVLQLAEVARPVPAADEVLVQVYATGVNRSEIRLRDGSINERMPMALPLLLGTDFAGVVDEAGADVTSFRPGDAVFGVANFPGSGTYAEYTVAKASLLAPKPASIGFVEAAAVPQAALTAWTGLYLAGHLLPGERILIHGASGGVGSFAVQLAKWTGAHVIATASAANQAFVKGLGADEVLDYRQPFEQHYAVLTNATGHLTDLFFTAGQCVHQGQILAKLERPDGSPYYIISPVTGRITASRLMLGGAYLPRHTVLATMDITRHPAGVSH